MAVTGSMPTSLKYPPWVSTVIRLGTCYSVVVGTSVILITFHLLCLPHLQTVDVFFVFMHFA